MKKRNCKICKGQGAIYREGNGSTAKITGYYEPCVCNKLKDEEEVNTKIRGAIYEGKKGYNL